MSVQCKFAKAEDAKKAGWFSRRHETTQQHFEEHERQRKRRENKLLDAVVRQETSAELSSKERLHILDMRLGKNVGAVKERARLKKTKKTRGKHEGNSVSSA